MPGSVPVTMPMLGLTMEEGTVAEWLKARRRRGAQGRAAADGRDGQGNPGGAVAGRVASCGGSWCSQGTTVAVRTPIAEIESASAVGTSGASSCRSAPSAGRPADLPSRPATPPPTPPPAAPDAAPPAAASAGDRRRASGSSCRRGRGCGHASWALTSRALAGYGSARADRRSRRAGVQAVDDRGAAHAGHAARAPVGAGARRRHRRTSRAPAQAAGSPRTTCCGRGARRRDRAPSCRGAERRWRVRPLTSGAPRSRPSVWLPPPRRPRGSRCSSTPTSPKRRASDSSSSPSSRAWACRNCPGMR